MVIRGLVGSTVAAIIVAAFAGQAQAADHIVNLTGADTFSTFTYQDDVQYHYALTGSLFTAQALDTVEATITFNNDVSVPIGTRDTTLLDIFSGDGFPGGDTKTTGSFTFYDDLGNVVATASGGSNTAEQVASGGALFPQFGALPFTFKYFTDDFTITELGGDTTGSVSQALNSAQFIIDVQAVPEPATWAMFLVGFGAIGWTLRSRRQSGAVTACYGR